MLWCTSLSHCYFCVTFLLLTNLTSFSILLAKMLYLAAHNVPKLYHTIWVDEVDNWSYYTAS